MRYLIVLILLICSIRHINAQGLPILDRKVTIKITNQPLGKVLNIISETADFNFSYGNQVVRVNKLVTIHAENRSVREVLDQLFNQEITYQQIGNHLILQKRIMSKNTKKAEASDIKPVKYNYILSGYLRDDISGDGLTNISMYEKQSLASTLSGDFGYYKMALTSRSPEIILKISGQAYKDTSVKITYENNGLIALNINLSNIAPSQTIEIADLNDSQALNLKDTPAISRKDSTATRLVWQDSSGKLYLKNIKVEETQMGKWLINNYQRVTERNIRDSFERKWQATIVPPIGSNRNLSGLVTNMISLNLLVGYNGGVNGVEFGGLVNFLRRDMRGAQFAGLSNIVGGNVKGVQFAGLLNNNYGKFEGFQAAGLFNHNMGLFSGVQAAGLYNYNNEYTKGAQLAGLLNGSRQGLKGVQIAGLGNLAGKRSEAVQIAGLFNLANDIKGGQLGVINVARKMKGFQIGVINIADSAEGISIGVVNFIKDGIHQLEMSMNEMRQYGLGYRSGTRAFYTHLMVTTQLPMLDSNTLMSYGAGVGTSVKISKVLRFTLDGGTYQQSFNFRSERLNLMNRVNANLEIRIIKGLHIFGGVAVSHLIADTRDSHYETRFRDFGNKPFWESTNGDFNQHAWIGYQFGLRLF